LIENKKLFRKGAESELYIVDWYGQKAILKIRIPKRYRHPSIDLALRKQRTLHAATIMSSVKMFDVETPFIYFLNSNSFEIIMEYIIGNTLKNIFSPKYCVNVGEVIAKLHTNNIIHGDITTSNFIVTPDNRLIMIDFGLSFFFRKVRR